MISTGPPAASGTSVVAVNASIAVNLLIGIAVLALLVYRQLQTRPVRDNMRLPLIIGIIGESNSPST